MPAAGPTHALGGEPRNDPLLSMEPDEQTPSELRPCPSAVALREWAVTCDALARGEQILLLRGDVDALTLPDERDPAGHEPADEPGGGAVPPAPTLRHDGFWLLPAWDRHDPRDVADPYRDRIQALEGLRRRDGKARIQFYADVDYGERITEPDRLLALDGQHTLNSVAVERLARSASDGAGVLLLLLRVFRRETAALVPWSELRDAPEDAGAWIGLQGRATADELTSGTPEGSMEPVMDAPRFLRRKARLLQLSRSIHAV